MKKVLDKKAGCPSIQGMRREFRDCFRFGPFEVDTRARVLRRDGVKIRLQEQPFQVLLALLEASGEIVTREQFRQRLWPEGTFVEFDHALNTAVKKIRAALCDDAAAPRYVETIPRRGYRLLAPVDKGDSTGAQLIRPPGGLAWFRVPIRLPWMAATIISGLAILLIYAVGGSFRLHSAHAITLAVLPLSDMNFNSGPHPLGAELSQALAERLRRTHPASMIVSAVARNEGRQKVSRMPYDREKIDYVLQGGVFLDSEDAHVAVQLVRIRDQNSVWAETFNCRVEGAAWEGELAAEIVGQLQPTLALLAGGSR